MDLGLMHRILDAVSAVSPELTMHGFPAEYSDQFDPLMVPRRCDGVTGRTFVYGLACGDFVKIGVARNIVDRASSAQTGNPEPIEVGMAVGCCCRLHAYALETAIHLYFTQTGRHVRGEWFRLVNLGHLASRLGHLCRRNSVVRSVEVRRGDGRWEVAWRPWHNSRDYKWADQMKPEWLKAAVQ